MDWFKDLYDDFRMRTGFGSIPVEQTRREVDFMFDVLNLSKSSRVLDLFCGPGRHSIELSRRGCVTLGIEYNADYLKLARERAKEANVSPQFIQGDVRNVDFGTDFDAAIIMYASFGYFEDAEDRNILRKIYSSLKPKGRFFIEIHNRDWMLKNYAARIEKVFDGIKVTNENEFDILKSRVNTILTRYEKDGPVVKNMSWRLYSPHEMKNILEDIGFSFVAGYSSLDKEPLTLDTKLMRLVFEKP